MLKMLEQEYIQRLALLIKRKIDKWGIYLKNI
ncbi:hypothetical protein SAMN05444275_11029 [Myroides odoratimimus subsp. xuanwuensis]|nr:hypothetical protein SAMN05444275_11029 [Myroides odoratimimus subsp. xuanwuensis]